MPLHIVAVATVASVAMLVTDLTIVAVAVVAVVVALDVAAAVDGFIAAPVAKLVGLHVM